MQLFVRFGVTPRRRKNRRSGDRGRKCFLCGFAIKALSREPHSVITRNCVRMSENCTIGDHSIAEIPMTGERGGPVFGHSAGELNFFPNLCLSPYLKGNRYVLQY